MPEVRECPLTFCEAAVPGYVLTMRATLMYGAGDVRVETVPDAHLTEPTDALVRVRRAAICVSDLWPYKSKEPTESGRRMGHEECLLSTNRRRGVRAMFG
jgi:hypothetical protein